MGPRLRGLVLLAAGLTLAKLQVYDPLHARELGLPHVTIYQLLVGLAVLLPVVGTSYLVFGARVDDFIDGVAFNPRRLNWRSVLVLLVVTVVCIWVWNVIGEQLALQGYR